MKKGLLLLVMALTLGFTACHNDKGKSNDKPVLTGTWIDPAVENSAASEKSITLMEDGTASSTNFYYTQYTNWERVGDLIILKGKNTGIHPGVFADTLWIDELTTDHLKLTEVNNKNNSVFYQRKK